MEMFHCYLCDRALPTQPAFSEERQGRKYDSFYCSSCSMYQTKGDIPPLSPDYLELASEHITERHVYNQTVEKALAFQEFLTLAERWTPPSPHRAVLDVGCGLGGFLDAAASCGYETFGYDLAETHIRWAQVRHPRAMVATSIGDYTKGLGLPRIAFSAITLWDVLEHLRDPIAELSALRPFLAEGGLLFASVPASGPIFLKLQLAKMRKSELGLIPWEHVFYHSRRSLADTFTRAGLRVLHVSGVAPYCRPEGEGAERTRRLAHRMLRHTPMAFQLGVYATLDRGPTPEA